MRIRTVKENSIRNKLSVLVTVAAVVGLLLPGLIIYFGCKYVGDTGTIFTILVFVSFIIEVALFVGLLIKTIKAEIPFVCKIIAIILLLLSGIAYLKSGNHWLEQMQRGAEVNLNTLPYIMAVYGELATGISTLLSIIKGIAPGYWKWVIGGVFLFVGGIILVTKSGDTNNDKRNTYRSSGSRSYSSSGYSSSFSTGFNASEYVHKNCTGYTYGVVSSAEMSKIDSDSSLTSSEKAAAKAEYEHMSGMYY